jgi:hypothetical protein
MKSIAKFELSSRESDVYAGPFREVSPQESRLENIRRISNIIQALENLVVQCEDQPDFIRIHGAARNFLRYSSHRLQHLIHQA